MKYISNILVTILVVLFSISCQKKANENETDNEKQNVIEITKEQFMAAKMVIGSPTPYHFEQIVNTKGYVSAAPNGIALINVSIPGQVKQIQYEVGQYVTKGSVLFKIEGDAIIQLQQDYAQNSAQLLLAKSDYERLEILANDNIASKKEYLQAHGNYQSLLAVHAGLKARLQLITIDPEKVESGKITPEIAVVAPISGYITERNLVQGEYIDQQRKAYEIVDNQKMNLYLNVFEADIASLKEGQKIEFYEPDRKDQVFEAQLVLIGKSIDKASKTIACVAQINQISNKQFINGMYAECAIITDEIESNAVPAEAVINDGFNTYVLVKTGEQDDLLQFSMVNVEIGRQEIDFIEVLTEGLSDVLMNGVFNLNIGE